MSLWLDMLGVEIRFVETKSFGKIRIAESGVGNPETILFMHGLNGHLEAYAKNLISLGKQFHVVAFDFVGHGLSDKPVLEYTPLVFAEQLGELMDALGLESAHLSGESLGGWVSAFFAVKYPNRVKRLMLNTAGGIPVVSEKGKADLANLIALNQRNVQATPTRDSVRARLEWLVHENNRSLVNDELISLRLRIYLMPETQQVAPVINKIINRHDEFLVPFEQMKTAPLFLWTADNPIHDLEAARSAAKRVPGSQVYVMNGDSAHWPQYEVPEEFDRVASEFFSTGKVSGCVPL